MLGIVSFANISTLPPTTQARLLLVRATVDLFHTLLLATRHTIAELPTDIRQAIVSSMAKLCAGAADIPAFEDVADYARDVLDFFLPSVDDGD